VRHLDERYFSPDADMADWVDEPDAAELAEALRSALDEGYAEASDEAMDDALANVLDAMSPAEGFNFASALNRISKGAGQLISDPAFVAVAQTALPIVAGAAGTLFYFYAAHDGLLAVVAVLTSLYPASTIVLARVVLGERLTVLRLAGLSLAGACVALIAAGGAA